MQITRGHSPYTRDVYDHTTSVESRRDVQHSAKRTDVDAREQAHGKPPVEQVVEGEILGRRVNADDAFNNSHSGNNFHQGQASDNRVNSSRHWAAARALAAYRFNAESIKIDSSIGHQRIDYYV